MQNTKRYNYNTKDASSIFLSAILIPQIAAIILSLIVSFIAIYANLEYQEIIKSAALTYILLFLAQVIFLAIFFIYNKIKNIDWVFASKIKNKINYKQAIILSLIALVSLYAFAPLIGLVDYLLSLTGYNASAELPIDLSTINGLIVGIFALAILPSIAEELLFRGIVYNGLQKLGNKKAIIISSLIFALMHLSAQQTVYQIIIGILLAYAVYVTGSLVGAMILHFVNNFTIIALTFYTEITGGETMVANFNSFFDFLLPIAYAVVGVIIIIFLFKALKYVSVENTNKIKLELGSKEKNPETNEAKSNREYRLLIIGFVIAIFFWVSNLFVSI